jgi:hypothetical protein
MNGIKNNKRIKEILLFYFLFATAITATISYHNNTGYYNWKSEIWADKAGYYIYLPSLFLYQFDANKCPEGIDEKTGYGFKIDPEGDKILTKYTYGVSFLLLPFFVIAILLSLLLDLPIDGGFGPLFHSMANVSSVIYLIGGLFLLYRFLLKYFSDLITLSVVVLLFLGTNLFYYGICDTLMSHVYSFFLFSLFLLSSRSFIDKPSEWRWFVLFTFSSVLIVLIRPTNIILWLLFFLLDCNGITDIRNRIRLITYWKRLLFFLTVLVLLLLPQLAYWKYLSGNWISWSYANEGFTNWNRPALIEVWFSTLNGLFVYTPIFILMMIGIFLMVKKKVSNGWLLLFYFLGISYLFSSWYCWYYGCSFGQRSYVEFYALFALPFGYLLQTIANHRLIVIRFSMLVLLTIMCIANVLLSFSFEKCFFGSTWDWDQFSRELNKAGLLRNETGFDNFKNDMENQSINFGIIRTDSVFYSRDHSAVIGSSTEFFDFRNTIFRHIGHQIPSQITVSFHALCGNNTSASFQVVCVVNRKDSVLFYQQQNVELSLCNPAEWTPINHSFKLPASCQADDLIKVYLWNELKNDFFIDDYQIKYN